MKPKKKTENTFQFSSVTQSCPTLCIPINFSTPGLPVYHQLPEFTQTHVHWVGDAVQPSHLLLSPSPPTFDLSQHQGLFQWVSSSHQVAKYWSFSFSISPSNEYSGLISFRMDWLDLLAVQGTLKSLIQYHSSKVSVLCRSDFFIVQLSHPYMTTGKNVFWLDRLVGMANHFSILTLKTPWTVWKGKIKIWHMKRCSILLSIREMKIKTTARYQLTPVRIVILEESKTNKC